MVDTLLKVFFLLVSSTAVLLLTYYKVPAAYIQQGVGVMIALMLALLRWVVPKVQTIGAGIRLLLILLISAFVQLLVLSSGGFFSPFLVLFHLLAISFSFLVDLATGIAFLVFAVAALGIDTWLDPKLYSLYQGDPFSVVLYVLSFVVLIPLYQIVASRYHLKDTVSQIMTVQMQLTKIRDESLWKGLSDLVFITDTKLKILSANEAVERLMQKSLADLQEKDLFEIVNLRSVEGEEVDYRYLAIDRVIKDRNVRITSDLLLYIRKDAIPKKVKVQIRPTANLEGVIDRIIFVISEGSGGQLGKQNLQQALVRHEEAINELNNRLAARGLVDVKRSVELIEKSERDILTALEIESSGVKPHLVLADMAQIVSSIITKEQIFAREMGVQLVLSYGNDFTSRFSLQNNQQSTNYPTELTNQYFSALVDEKLTNLMVQKIIDLLILLTSSKSVSSMTVPSAVNCQINYDSKTVELDLFAPFGQNNFNPDLLLTEYYDGLIDQTNLKLGSGLEGYLAHTIANLCNIPLKVYLQKNPSGVLFKIQFSKMPYLGSQ
ncbi:PAS domain-containing protein [Patescibacteria group bacterium]|nr:PAS domain-containing protein [Patescibacteria group bacterium]